MYSDNLIDISETAKRQFLDLGANREQFLRLWIEAGGCSGMSYQAALDTVQTPFDREIYGDDDLKIVTDGESLGYLHGLRIDYSDDLVRAGFRFDNPNAVKSCGCGSSFESPPVPVGEGGNA